MNLRLVFRFASILCLSSARARSRKPKSLKNLIYMSIALAWTLLIIHKLLHPEFLPIYSAVAMTMIIGSIITIVAYKLALQSFRELCISQGDLL